VVVGRGHPNSSGCAGKLSGRGGKLARKTRKGRGTNALAEGGDLRKKIQKKGGDEPTARNVV